MAEEITNPLTPATPLAAALTAPPAASSTTAQSPKAQPGAEIQRILGGVTQYSVLGVFLLYAVGFVIWHAYLGRFGVSAIPFLQTEYISAAFCYSLFVALLTLGPMLVIRQVSLRLHGIRGKPTNLAIALLWGLVWLLASATFFESPTDVRIPLAVLRVLGVIIIVHSLFGLILRLKFPHSKLFSIAVDYEYVPAYFVLLIVATAAFTPGANPFFVVLTLVFIPGCIAMTMQLQELSSEFRRPIQAIFICIIAMLHIAIFGDVQFGAISREIGGGKPEKAYLRFSPLTSGLDASLNLTTVTNNAFTNGFVGPVAILLRTEKDFIFIGRTTNIVAGLPHGSAKQVRAELVDAVVYEKDEKR
jgi:hypothetical protein